MAGDLHTEAASMTAAATNLRNATHKLPKALSAFRAAAGDLSAFGALGSLTSATHTVGHAMDQLGDAVEALQSEWGSEATAIGDIGTLLDEVDKLIAEQLGKGKV
ncbi:hypothetical protein [Streptomyces sp. RKAG337]|uniref:hypothetical protein n=1 Tax=Streptomyces sp. RKAG337 TaxID=2893404 RepID=UPI002033D7FD|nr:hypothetical protein [Streptomyces sp. RKAG337]MCM2426997.1 hypothetical protein [Streptomyces sp. RKAG337]